MTQIENKDAVGSLWNPNNWHWEEKNYTAWSTKYIARILDEFVVSKEGLGEITFTDYKCDGEASISVRKGKRIAAADYKIAFSWKAMASSNAQSYTGHISIPDFSAEDDSFEIVIRGSEETEDDSKFLALVRSEGESYLRNRLGQYHKDLLQADEANLEEDRQKRTAALHTAQKAAEEKGEEKNMIAAQQKLADLERKAQAAATAPASTPQKILAEGQGSVWNTNSYHWEEKNRTEWCLKELRNRLEKVEVMEEGFWW
eukprot:GHVQ01043362.1.p1 GENE.GHVQ01043362.1~~GHVQ01043362.1.p1  ORF type:complete len:258 (-),score=59.22 GHVQ01043362.1:372-1145(-)